MTVPSLPHRPLLTPALTRTWRGPDRLQLGIATRTPVVLEGIDTGDARFLLGLDGHCDRRAALEQAASLGLPTARAEHLLSLLDSAGCLADGATDAHSLAALDPSDRARLAADLAALSLLPPARSRGLARFARRRAACIEVRGAGRVGAALTTLLAASGVGTVSVADDTAVRPEDVAPLGPHPGSVGRPRSDAAVEAALRTAPQLSRDADRPPDLVVLTDRPVVDPSAADALLGLGIPHLAVTMVETTATVGPLVTPAGGPCLRCLDLHRCDRDPDWPLVAAQLSPADGGRRLRSTVDACDVVLATCAASLAALMVLAWIGAPAETPEAADEALTVEPGTAYVLRLPAGRPRPRTYSRHPRCGCSWGGPQ